MRLIISLFLAVVIQPLCFSATFYVDDDFTSSTPGWGVDHFDLIQDGINAASNGDEIIVNPGTYIENIDFITKAITLRSDLDGVSSTYDIAPFLTIIDGNQTGSVVSFRSGETNTSVLDGFTITNGSGNPNGPNFSEGGGVFIKKSSPTVTNNIIINNSVAHSDNGYGGGIYCYSYNYYYVPIISNNVIANNQADQGGGVYGYQGTITFTNNTITGNHAPQGGGYRMRYISGKVTNTIIWGNTPFEIDQEGPLPAISVNYCNIAGGWPGAETTNIDADPVFVDPMGDYHLALGSPCIDAGDNLADGLFTVDIDGEDRIIDGDAVPGAIIDIGADEYFGNETPTADLVCDQLTNIGAAALMRLDASGSTDPEDLLTDLSFEWTIDGVPSTETLPVIEVYLDFGPHIISLKVTDTGDASDVITKDLQIDPAALSVLEPQWVHVNWHSSCSYVDIKGEIGMPSGVNYTEILPMVDSSLSIAGLPVAPLDTVLFNVKGHYSQRWSFKDCATTNGISRFNIDWRGARYYYREHCFPVKLRSQIITSEETVLTIYMKKWKIKSPFTIDFDSKGSIHIDENGNVIQSDVPYDVERAGKQISVTLPFPFLNETMINITGGLNRALTVGDKLKESVGRFRLRVKFDPNNYLQGVNTQPRTMDFTLNAGIQGYPGEFHLNPADFKVFWNRWFKFRF